MKPGAYASAYAHTNQKRRSRSLTGPNSKRTNNMLASNPFHVLAARGESIERNERKKPKPPPVVLTNINYENARKFLSNNKISNFALKITSVGIKLQLESDEEFDAVCSRLNKLENAEYYTHRKKEERAFKAVMYGLPKTELSEIKNFFTTELNITPNGIFELKSRGNNPNNATYLFHFDRKNISMEILKKIKVVNHTIVKWAPYSPKFKGPTQCRSCTMYGHGAENCHRFNICVYCASTEHESSKCQMNPANSSTANNNGAVFKCSSCSVQNKPSNHAATDPNCPARIQYLAIRQKSNNNNKTNRNNNASESQNRGMQNLRQPQIKHNMSAQGMRSAQSNRNMPLMSAFQSRSYADAVKQAPTNRDELYSMPELFNIFSDAMEQLSQCRTKIDQIAVIVKLLEYAAK